MTEVVTRIPPSPTGHLHIGTARTALFNYLFARHAGGSIVFRSENTDRARSTQEFEDEIIDGLRWLGLSWDSFSRQSERGPRYRELLEKLIGEGKAYKSDETKRSETLDRPRKNLDEVMNLRAEVIRLKNPGRTVTFHDEIRGDITFDTTELGDFVIARAIDDPLYHFAVVADDMDAHVTHVIRGEDHISNTPRQILIQEALGAPRPAYAHLPLILDEKRAKLSKRSPSGVPEIPQLREEGILPEALVNYLALLGWNPGSDREDFSLAELVDEFTLNGVQKSGAVWDRTKLLSVNQRWMRKLSEKDLLFALGIVHVGNQAIPAKLLKTMPLLKERASTLAEAKQMLEGELQCLFSTPRPALDTLIAKELPSRPGIARESLSAILKLVQGLPEDVSVETVKDSVMPLADAEETEGKGGRGAVLWPLRYALSGQERSPDPFTIISVIGPADAAMRIEQALKILGKED
ncbi:MAG TPA: glutamate--tRNA ligase [Candidatus Paceibacterota bacterium]|nr:glutamate--tRNA ligase [Candidatus Paceibacterota bacterium]